MRVRWRENFPRGAIFRWTQRIQLHRPFANAVEFFVITTNIIKVETCMSIKINTFSNLKGGNSLYKALAYFRVNLSCDVLGARLSYANGRLQASAGYLPNPLNIIFWIFGLSGFHPKSSSYFKKAHQVEWVMGAFLMLKRKVWEKSLLSKWLFKSAGKPRVARDARSVRHTFNIKYYRHDCFEKSCGNEVDL